VTAALVACGGSHGPRVSADGSAVLRDFTDNGKVDGRWSCGSLRTALERVPGSGEAPYSGFAIDFVAPTARACDDAFATIQNGMTHEQVRIAFGKPSFVDPDDRCELYEWPRNKKSENLARVCFTRGHVTRVQVAT
jgi:hypothetical protein